MNDVFIMLVYFCGFFQKSRDVDYKIMATFVEFYCTMLGFINFRLYHSLGVYYPPKVSYTTLEQLKFVIVIIIINIIIIIIIIIIISIIIIVIIIISTILLIFIIYQSLTCPQKAMKKTIAVWKTRN